MLSLEAFAVHTYPLAQTGPRLNIHQTDSPAATSECMATLITAITEIETGEAPSASAAAAAASSPSTMMISNMISDMA